MSEKDNEGFLPSHGAYENLLSYRKAEIVYDLTFGFCFLQNGGVRERE